MGLFIAEQLIAKPFIDGLRHNGFIAEQRIWDEFTSGIMVQHTNGTKYIADDVDAFVVNNSYTSSTSLPAVSITADKTVTVPRANVQKVIIKNTTLKLQENFLRSAFYQCDNLTEVIFDNVVIDRNEVTNADYYFGYCFSSCSSLMSCPVLPALPEGVISANRCFYYTFRNCAALLTAPEIPPFPTTITSAGYYLHTCFSNCVLLTNELIPNIPPFTGTGITTVPAQCTVNYAGNNCPATPDRPITDLATFLSGYNYH